MNKKNCDWCGKTFRRKTLYVEYTDDSCYHHSCLKSVRKGWINGSVKNDL